MGRDFDFWPYYIVRPLIDTPYLADRLDQINQELKVKNEELRGEATVSPVKRRRLRREKRNTQDT